MDRCALFVDAGYALADGAMAVHGTRRRDSVTWDYAGLLKLLAGLARDRTGLPVLRCYWYETAPEGRRTAEHDALAEMPGLKLRLVNAQPGRREGIESQLRRDLVTLAKSGAITDAFIASANEHIAETVAEVQDLGLRVVILHIASDGGWTIPLPLRQECDDIVEISGVHLRSYVDLIRGAEPAPAEDAYPAGAYGARGLTDAKAALTHHGQPAAALPAPGAVYQLPDGYGQSAVQSGAASIGYPAEGVVVGAGSQLSQQYLGAPAGNSGAAIPAQSEGGSSGRGQSAAELAQAGQGTQSSAPQGTAAANGLAIAGQIPYGTPPASYAGPMQQAAAGPVGYQGNGQSANQPGGGPADNAIRADGMPAGYQLAPGQPGGGQAAGGYPNGSTGIYQSGPANGYQNGAGQNGASQLNGSGQNGAGQNGAGHIPGQNAAAGQNGLLQGGPGQSGPGQGGQNGVPLNGAGLNGSGPGNPASGAQAYNGPTLGGGAQNAALQPGGMPNGLPVNGGMPAGLPANGGMSNGMPANGGSPNGMISSGMTSNGMSPSGAASNGMPPNAAMPGGAAQNSFAPNGAGILQNGSGHNEASQHGVSQHGVSQHGVGQQGPGQQAPGQHGAGQQGPGQHGANPGGGPNGVGLNSAGPNGAGPNGAGQNGAGQNGAAQNGSVRYGYQGNQPSQGPMTPFPAGQPEPNSQYPGYPNGQNGGGRPGQVPPGFQPASQQGGSAGFGAGGQQGDPRGRDPYGQLVPSQGAGFDNAPLVGQPSFGPPDNGFSQGMTGQGVGQGQRAFGQNQAQGVGALIQAQNPQAVAPLQAVRAQQVAIALPEAVKAAHAEGFTFGESVGRDAPGLWLEAVLARKPRMPSDLEARLLQGSVLPIDSLLHDEVRHSLRRGFWDALESARR